MSLAREITPHLPYLRRFARALTGSQVAGDNYVAAVLEALIADSSVLRVMEDRRAALYKTLLQLWGSLEVNQRPESNGRDWNTAGERNLQAISPRPRQAFLLTTVEGFDRSTAAAILDVSDDEYGALIDEAAHDIADQVATKVMIIEDEPLIAMDIEAMVEDLGHSVTGIARTHSEALDLFRKERPGIVLADIQLADGSSGLDAVNDILGEISVPVIFITAFPERLLTGERPEPAFLVTKPFQPQMVSALISQALFFSDEPATAA